MADVVLNQLYKFSPLQTSFGVNMLALNGGRPEMLNLKQILRAFIDFREEVITRRTAHELGKARQRAHIMAGLAVAVENIDPVIELIRNAKDGDDARIKLMATAWPAKNIAPLIELIGDPAHRIVDGVYQLWRIRQKLFLTFACSDSPGLSERKSRQILRELCDKITEYLAILADKDLLFTILRDELLEMREQFANDRRTSIEEHELEQDIEDLIQQEDMVVTVSDAGYIKRVPLSAYRAQNRGGKGRSGMSTRDEDFVSNVFVAHTHQPLLFSRPAAWSTS